MEKLLDKLFLYHSNEYSKLELIYKENKHGFRVYDIEDLDKIIDAAISNKEPVECPIDDLEPEQIPIEQKNALFRKMKELIKPSYLDTEAYVLALVFKGKYGVHFSYLFPQCYKTLIYMYLNKSL